MKKCYVFLTLFGSEPLIIGAGRLYFIQEKTPLIKRSPIPIRMKFYDHLDDVLQHDLILVEYGCPFLLYFLLSR